jgi:hypothetical protein
MIRWSLGEAICHIEFTHIHTHISPKVLSVSFVEYVTARPIHTENNYI